jgi:hypothetical protein
MAYKKSSAKLQRKVNFTPPEKLNNVKCKENKIIGALFLILKNN